MKRYFGLFVMVAMFVMALGCQMPGMPGSDWNDSQSWNLPALTADQAGVTFSLPSTGARSMNITKEWASTYANLYQLYVYDSTGTVLHSVPVSTGSINLAINMSAASGTYKVIVVAGRTPNPSNPSTYPAYMLGAGTTTVTLQKGQITPVTIHLNTTDIAVPGATPATTGQVMNGTVTGSFGIHEIGINGPDAAVRGYIGNNAVTSCIQFSLGHTDTTTGLFAGNFSITMPTSLTVDPSVVSLWYSSTALEINESVASGGFANVSYEMGSDGTSGWVLPTQWQWHPNWFEPPFSTTTDITVTYGPTQLAGTIGW